MMSFPELVTVILLYQPLSLMVAVEVLAVKLPRLGNSGEFRENGQRVTAFFFQIGNGALNPGGIFQVDHFVGIAAYPTLILP